MSYVITDKEREYKCPKCKETLYVWCQLSEGYGCNAGLKDSEGNQLTDVDEEAER